jgi:hypothetical protein
LPKTLDDLSEAGLLNAGQALSMQIVPDRKGVALERVEAKLQSVEFGVWVRANASFFPGVAVAGLLRWRAAGRRRVIGPGYAGSAAPAASGRSAVGQGHGR